MNDHQTQSYIVGVGVGVLNGEGAVQPAPPEAEMVAAGRSTWGRNARQALSRSGDRLGQQFGPDVYDAMLCDPVALGAFDVIRLGILGGEMRIPPTHQAEPGDDAETREIARSREIAEFCTRLTDGIEGGFERFLHEALEHLPLCHKLAEKVYRREMFGPDKGRLVLDRLKFKPGWAWNFVVDSKLNVLGILAWNADDAGIAVYPRSKFAVFTHGERDGDPRGNSILRAAYDAWNQKVAECVPGYERFRRRFGQPVPIGKTPEATGNANVRRPRLGADGRPIPGAAGVTAQEELAEQLANWQEGEVLAVPFGTEIDLAEPDADGNVYLKALEFFNREITVAILKNSRTTQEAEHGSKADSETGADVTGLVVRLYSRLFARAIRDEILMPSVALNFGEEDARLYTPTPTFGETEHQDFAEVADAVAGLERANYLSPSQKPALDKKLNLPVRTPEEVADEAERKKAAKPAGPDDATGEDDDDRTGGDDPPPAAKKKAKPR